MEIVAEALDNLLESKSYHEKNLTSLVFVSSVLGYKDLAENRTIGQTLFLDNQ